MFIFPEQKIPTAKKDKKWRVDCVNYIINDAMHERYDDISRMIDNYNLINSQLNQDDYREICSGLGVSMQDGRKYVQAYNKTFNIVSTLKGEELRRPFNYRIINMSPSTVNEIMKEQEMEIKSVLDNIIKFDLERIQVENEVNKMIQDEKIPPGKYNSELERRLKYIDRRYQNTSLDPTILLSGYKNKLTTKEKMINKLMRVVEKRNKLRWIKNETFTDAIVAGKEFVEIRVEKEGDLPKIRQLNPLNVFYHKSPDTAFIQDSDYAGYIEELTIGRVLDLYGDRMHPDDLRRLQQYNYDGSGTYGTTDTFYHTREDRHADSWAAKREAGIYPSGRDIDPHGLMILDGKYMAVPGSGKHHSGQVYGAGLYNNQHVYRRPYCIVYTVYWSSQRKLVKHMFQDETGTMQTEVVDESFYIPKNAKRETYQSLIFSPSKVRKVWYDEQGNYHSAEEIWLKEIWKGVRINGDIFLDVEPVQHAYQSLLFPYESKIPIYGYIYNARNAYTVCPVDRIKPWQKLYYVIMAKLLKLISQDKGVWTFINSLMLDKDLGIEETFRMAEDLGIISYNPLSANRGGQVYNTMKVAEKLDLTNAGSIQYYISLLQFIEANMKEAGQMSDNRLAQAAIGGSQTASEAQARSMASFNMTEQLFYNHDLLWEDVMQGLMEMTVSVINNSNNSIRGFLSDDEIVVLDMAPFSLEDEFLLTMSNNSRSAEILEQSQNLALTLIQNDRAKFSTLIDMLRTEDINEFREQLKAVEDDFERKQEQLEMRKMELQRELMDRQISDREDQQKAQLDEIYLKALADEKREHIKGRYMMTSFNLQHDKNQNGVPDVMENIREYDKLLADIGRTEEDVKLRAAELDQRTREHYENQALEREKLQRDAELKSRELASKERIEKIKSSNKKKKDD